jgi:FixJ family two-component response regulator
MPARFVVAGVERQKISRGVADTAINIGPSTEEKADIVQNTIELTHVFEPRTSKGRDLIGPIIFITAHGDIPMTVRAMKAGAVEFLTKPFRDQDLLDAIHAALEQDRAERQQEEEMATLRQRWESLTPREREVLPFVVSGLLNKQIAGQIGTSETTVKVHRGQLMRKMGADSLAELVRLAERIGIPYTKP